MPDTVIGLKIQVAGDAARGLAELVKVTAEGAKAAQDLARATTVMLPPRSAAPTMLAPSPRTSPVGAAFAPPAPMPVGPGGDLARWGALGKVALDNQARAMPAAPASPLVGPVRPEGGRADWTRRSTAGEAGYTGKGMQEAIDRAREYDRLLKQSGATGRQVTREIADGWGNVVKVTGMEAEAVRVLEGEMKKLGQQEQQFRGRGKVTQALFGDVGGGLLGQLTGGGGLAGMFGKVGALGVGGLGMAGAQMAAGSATRLLNAANDPTRAPELRKQDTLEALPVVGGLIKSFRELKEAADGTTAGLKKIAMYNPIQQQGVVAQGQERSGRAAIEAEQIGLQARKYAFAEYTGKGSEMPRLKEVDRSTAKGELEHEKQVRMLPLEMGQRQAKLGAVEAKVRVGQLGREAEHKQEQFDLAQKRADRATENRKRTLAKTGDAGPGEKPIKVQKGQALADEERALLELEQRRVELQQAQERHQQGMVGAAQAESSARKALIAVDQERLNLLVQQGERMKAAAQGFGGMQLGDRVSAAQAARMAKERGFGALTHEQQGLLERAGAGNYVRKERQKLGEADPLFGALKDLDPTIAGDIKKNEKEQIKVANEIQANIALDEKKLAEEMANKLGPALEKTIETISKALDIKIRQLELEIKKIQYGTR